MTEEFMKIVKKHFEFHKNLHADVVRMQKTSLDNQIERYNTIHELLKDEKVREFADLISYKEKPVTEEYIGPFYTMKDFLIQNMTGFEWTLDDLKKDKYPIYCYVGLKQPIVKNLIGKKASYYDIYWSLQRKGLVFASPNDLECYGTNREEFKKTHDIIYTPEGKSFYDSNTFYEVQAEYVEEALRTNQEEAKKLILSKYGRM